MAKFKHELAKLAFVVALMALMLTFFGGLSLLLEYLGWDYVRTISMTVMVCGIYMMLISIRFRPVAGGRRFNLPGIIAGTALTCGAALYGVFENAAWFIICLLLPFVIGGIVAGIKAEAKAKAGGSTGGS